jgi:hypothetical protein
MHQFSTSIGAVKGIKERAGKALKPGGSIFQFLLLQLRRYTSFITFA